MRTAVTLFTIFFMAAALYLCARYEKTPDSIFTGKVNTPRRRMVNGHFVRCPEGNCHLQPCGQG